MTQITVEAYGCIPLAPGAYSATTTEFITVNFGPRDTSKDVIAKANAQLSARGLCQVDKYGMMVITPIHQSDSYVMKGGHKVFSSSFDKLVAQSTDWTKLPDYPAWSKMMSDIPAGY